MFHGGVGNVVLAPVSEVLSRVLVQVTETVQAARDVLIEQNSFAQLSCYLEKIKPVLTELEEKGVGDTPTIRAALESLGRELKNAKDLIDKCSSKSRFYLLINCRAFMKQMQHITNEIGLALSLIPLANLDLSLDSKEKTKDLCQEMQAAEFKAAMAEEEIVDRIESGVRDRRKSSNYANDLLIQIAKAVGVPVDPSSLKQELEEFKKEKEAAQLQKNKAEALQLEQVASLLSWADAAHSASEREKQYRARRLSLGMNPLSALQSFYCPITQEVMEDPVEVSSGHTFERCAIEKWFAEGRKVCPVSLVELENMGLKPNIILRQSIEEWKERNTVIELTAMAPKLKSENEGLVVTALLELQMLCEGKTMYRHWIAAEGLIPVLVNLLKSSKSNIRKRTLATLAILVKDNIDNKGRFCVAGGITLAVHSLARDASEARQAVALILELSKDPKLCEDVSKVQGCILLLVTMTNSEIPQAAEDAKGVLENLSKEALNVVLMAEANYFKPLVQCLNEGSKMTQTVMANALARMELTDQSRAVLVQQGAVPPLVTMASIGNLEAKSAALGALRNLSNLPENRDHMVEAGVVQPLLELLFTVNSVLMTLKEHASAIFANLAVVSTSNDPAIDLLGKFSKPDETIYKLLSLLSLTGPSIQSHILRALNGMCCQPSGQKVRMITRVAGAVQLLVGFCVLNTDSEVRLNSLKLLFSLTQGGDGTDLSGEMGQKSVEFLVNLIVTSSREEEKAAAMGILGNFPMNDKQATEMMLQAGVLSAIVEILTKCIRGPAVQKGQLVENTTGVLLRFTLPSDLVLQQRTAEQNVIPILVHLLSSGTPLTKCRAATSLGQFSESTVKLSTRMKRPTGFRCFAPPPEPGCKVHGGICSVKSSFCLVEAEAIPVLLQTLEEKEEGTGEAALGALATLLYDEFLEKGAEAIAEARGIGPIIRLLTTGTSGEKEKAVWILEKLFRIERYRLQYGNSAQMPIIALTQDGTNTTRPLAARILAHLNILHDQSTYF